jgi:hypothetical protein
VLIGIISGPVILCTIGIIVFRGFGSIPEIADEITILIINACLISFPFVIIGLFGRRNSIKPWIIGGALTALFWGYFIYDTFFLPEGGVNIGLSLFMLSSPLLITFACVASIASERRAEGLRSD